MTTSREILDRSTRRDDVTLESDDHADTPARRWRLSARDCWPWLVYLITSYLVLYPVIAAPVVADDFANPFVQVDDGGVSLADGLGYGWNGATEGASFRILGSVVGSFVNWSLLWMSATFDLSISTLYSVEKFTVIVVCAMTAAWFGRVAAELLGRRVGVFTSTALVSGALFCTLQIHAHWSNDPVANYPLVGFGGGTMGMLTLITAGRVVLQPTSTRVAWAAITAVAAVSYYEMSLGAVIGAGLILIAGVRRHWANRSYRSRLIVGVLAVVAAPAVLVFIGRRITGDRANTYGGTTVRIGRDAIETFGYGMAGTMPGVAWRLSIRTLGGTLGLVFVAIGIVVLLVWLLVGNFGNLVANEARSDADPPAVDRLMAGALAAALFVYWCFAAAIQAITDKVQDETLGFGYVYSSYAVGALIVALALAAIAREILRRRPSPVRVLIGCGVVAFVFVQLTINWRLSESLNDAFLVNRRVLAAFDDDVLPPQRCQALTDWAGNPWPDYYEDGVTDGIQIAYEHYFGEPFCVGFVRPP